MSASPVHCFSCHKRRAAHLINENGICSYCLVQLARENSRDYIPSRVRKAKERRLSQLASKYGITSDDYRSMHERQGGRCSICGEPSTHARGLFVDHDHETGMVRDLLCTPCNSGLGHFKDNPSLLLAAIEYLSRHGRSGSVAS